MKENKSNNPLQLIYDAFPKYKFIEDGNPMYEGVEMDNWWNAFQYSESSKDFMDSIVSTSYRIIGKLQEYGKRTGIDVAQNIQNLETAIEIIEEEYQNIESDTTPLKSREEAENYIEKLGKIYRQITLFEDSLLLGRYAK